MTTATRVPSQPSQELTPNPDSTHLPVPHPAPIVDGDVDGDNPEDVLFDSLRTLYEYQPITLTSAGAYFTYTHPAPIITTHKNSTTITLETPDPEAANWSLHASSVWIASTQLAYGVDFLHLDEHLKRKDTTGKTLRVLELGAAAGLPSILIAKLYPDVSVLATDYPDKRLIHTLSQNVKRNGVGVNCRAMPYAWGSDPMTLISSEFTGGFGFDVIIAADTLWNPDSHTIFVDTLQRTLCKDPAARVHLVAGLHTGRYTIDSFLRAVARASFQVVEVLEREVISTNGERGRQRQWDVSRAEYEEEKDRRGWVIWIELCWKES